MPFPKAMDKGNFELARLVIAAGTQAANSRRMLSAAALRRHIGTNADRRDQSGRRPKADSR
jgi:hypothetical protein